jgi:hypothetical protein
MGRKDRGRELELGPECYETNRGRYSKPWTDGAKKRGSDSEGRRGWLGVSGEQRQCVYAGAGWYSVVDEE